MTARKWTLVGMGAQTTLAYHATDGGDKAKVSGLHAQQSQLPSEPTGETLGEVLLR